MLEQVGTFLKSWGTIGVAILALIQPWLLVAWRRVCSARGNGCHW
jgi:hypothetical protein